MKKSSQRWILAMLGICSIGTTFADNEFVVHDVEKGLITVYSQDKSYGITLQDKNLWATTVGTGESSYGNYYQWGNNHGNPAGSSTSTDLLTRDDSYNQKGYDGAVTSFIQNGNTKFDIRSDNTSHDDLRGGANDSASNNYGYDLTTHRVTNSENRQGPCPEGFHVPSAGEWSHLLELYYATQEGITLKGSSLKYTYDDSNLNFVNDLKIPFAGNRGYADGSMINTGRYGVLWSSSPGSQLARYLLVPYDGSVCASNNYRRAYGLAVRCFQNSPENPPKTSSLSLSASSWDLVASEEVSFSNGVVSYTQSVRDAIQSIREFLQLSEKYIIEWYQTNAQGEKEVVEIESINSTESMALSGQVKKKWMCKPPAHYHGEGN